jgi:hypothetical protein
MGGKGAAAVCAGDRGRPELEGGCICNRVCSSSCEGFRMLGMLNGLEGDGSVNKDGSLLVEVTEPSGGRVVLEAAVGG